MSAQAPGRAARPFVVTGLVAIAAMLGGCFGGGSSSDRSERNGSGEPSPLSGVFIDSPVQGLRYQTSSRDGLTDVEGRFDYLPGETITFYLGELTLGSAVADGILSPVDLLDPVDGIEDRAVVNMAVLLQSLDEDGNLNNGIQITGAIADVVSAHANALLWDQPSADFASVVQNLLDELNAAEPALFTDTDPRPRRVVDATDAREHLQRSLGPRRVVTTRYGDLAGFEADEGAWAWYGIPYARPPLGELRWRPPQPPEPWQGVRQATAWADQSAQPLMFEPFGEGGMSEDSLYLNVIVPKGYEGEALPVMVWFHGGGFRHLTANTRAFNNTALPAEGVIVVTVNHRLGALGYLAHPALSDESEHGGSGNYGQLDLIAALQWVQSSIAAFGGDPGNVTIFGESGGGGKVLSLLHSPLARGLFQKAIVQSGMGTPEAGGRYPLRLPLEEYEREGERLVAALELDASENLTDALRSLSWLELVQAADHISFESYPNIDGWYMIQGIREAFEAREQNDVPIMAGANTGDYPDLREGLLYYMPWMAEHNESDVYAYVFDHVPDNWAAAGVEAYHGIELVYLFGYYDSFFVHYLLGLTGLPSPSPQNFATNPPGISERDDVVGAAMRSMWSQFARTGDPGTATYEWPAYTPDNDTYLLIDPNTRTGSGLEAAFP